MSDIVEHRNQALVQLYSSIISGCFVQSLSTLLGMTAGWYTVQPPSPQKIVVRDVFPVIAGGLWGAGIGFLLGLLIINRKLQELRDGRF